MCIEDRAAQILGEDDRPSDILFRVAAHEAGHVLVGLTKGLIVQPAILVPGQGTSGMTYFSERSGLLQAE
jgi:hypothetical protein